MLIGTIRPAEVKTVELEGETLAEIRNAAAAPDGWELIDAPVSMHAGSTKLTATARFARRDGVEEVEADSMAALEAKIPEGWKLLAVRRI